MNLSEAVPLLPTPQVSPWQVIGASVQGTSHVKHHLPCQDAHAYCYLPGGGLVLVVADGAGSAKHSASGADEAVKTSLATVTEAWRVGLQHESHPTEKMWDALIRLLFTRARQSVLDLAKKQHHWSRDYATTLTLAIAASGWLAVGQIGDGAVVVFDAEDRFYTATHLQKGEYANETHFLTQRDALKQVQVRAEPCAVRALAAMTDGLIRLALRLPSGEPHTPFFTPLFGFAAQPQTSQEGSQQLERFLSSERVCARTDDDKTLLLAAYTSPTALGKIIPVDATQGAA